MYNPVFVLGLSTPGIFLLRHFLKYKIITYGFDSNINELGFKSKYGIKVVCPDPEINDKEFIDFLIDFRKNTDKNPVIIPTADKYVLPLNDYAETLLEYFNFTVPKGGILRKLTSKKETYELAVKHGFPSPNTCFASNPEELDSFVKQADFPCILKPEFPESWRTGFLEEFCKGSKVILVKSPNELYEKYEVIKKYDNRVIAQEIIKGDDSNLHYFVSYIDNNRNCIGSFTGIKERIAPIHFGSASYVNIVYNENLEIIATNWLKEMGFWGISGIEVKKDDRDNKFKLIEVNPRFGLWDEVGTRFGIDIAMMCYNELVNNELTPIKKTTINIRWISIHRDIRASAEYISEGILSIGKIAESYLNFPIYISDLKLNDLRLTFYLLKKLFKGFIRKIFSINK